MKHLTIVSGDPSSDVYAYHLARSLLEQDSTWSIHGIGGEQLRSIAPDVLDQQPLCLVGFVEIFKHLWDILKLRSHFLRSLRKKPAHTILLLDCPGFNMNILPKISRKHTVIYAIPPQIWAWHESRIKKLKQYCNEVWVIYPFEVIFYQKHGLQTRLLKHPLIDKEHLNTRALLPTGARMKVALLPGSRGSEHNHLMKYYIHLSQSRPDIDWVWVEHRQDSLSQWHHDMKGEIVTGLTALPEVHAAVATSGTVTLELALMGLPCIVIYKVSWLTAMIARRLITIPWVSLPNILLQDIIYPELIQNDLNHVTLGAQLDQLLLFDVRQAQYQMLQKIRLQLNKSAPDMTACLMKRLVAL